MQQTVILSKEQAAAFAAAILPDIVHAFIESNKEEFEEWLKERQKQAEKEG